MVMGVGASREHVGENSVKFSFVAFLLVCSFFDQRSCWIVQTADLVSRLSGGSGAPAVGAFASEGSVGPRTRRGAAAAGARVYTVRSRHPDACGVSKSILAP